MRRGGGLYGNFVSASDNVENKAYRGAEIPPPSCLNSGAPKNNKVVGNSSGSGSGLSKHGYSTMNSIADSSMSYSQYGVSIKRGRTEEEYFNSASDEEKEKHEDDDDGGYQPAPGSPGPGDEEDDPLDAYMKELEQEAITKGVANTGPPVSSVKTATTSSSSITSSSSGNPRILKTGMIMKKQTVTEMKGVRDDIEEEDSEESYYRWLEENPNAGKQLEDDDELDHIDYDADGNPIAPEKNKHIDPLPAIDHNEIKYEEFTKNFYEEHSDISGLSKIQVIDLQQKHNVKVSGPSPPRPVSSFAHFGFDEPLMKSIRKSEFTQPTAIQATAIPSVLSGRDVLGIAQTGSGKTCSFIWPMLVHIMDQRELRRGEGPIALVLVPTRELALQIFTEVKRYCRVYNIEVVCAYGGGNKYEQSKTFEKGAEIAIATPGRMIDMIKMKVTNLERVTYLVLDEADRMFDMGFEPQVRSLCDHVRPDRQCQLYSATFKKRIEKLARDVLTDPVKVVQGEVGVVADTVTQNVMVVSLGGHKWQWLIKNLVKFMSEGSVLVFVTKKQNCEELAHNLKVKAEIDCRCLQGDMFQTERNDIISSFKKQDFPVLVATDVAARGLDIPHIRNVVNFDVARDIDTHTHRVGRTGRAGLKGAAHTLVTVNDKEFAGHLVRNLESSGQSVSKELYDLAMQSSWFKNSRFKGGKGKGVGGAGLGFKERPALGYSGGSSEGGSASSQDKTTLSEQYKYDKKHKEGLARPGTDRLSAIKQAYKHQFMSNFKSAQTEEGGYNPNSKIIQEEPAPPGTSRRKKSRWE